MRGTSRKEEMEKFILEAQEREVIGKKVKALRREGLLPAVIYGSGMEPMPITLNTREVRQTLSSIGANTLVTIKLGKKELEWPATAIGDWVEHYGWKASVPAGSRLVWPKKSHNPYKKDGSSSLKKARMVLCLPFSAAVSKHEVALEITK